MKHWKSSALALFATASLIATVGSVYAKTTNSPAPHRANFWGTVASQLHISPATLTQAIKQAEISQMTRNAAAHHLSTQAISQKSEGNNRFLVICFFWLGS